jgi:hypothetical protein
MRRTILIAVLVLGLAVALLSLGTSSGTQDQLPCTVTVQAGESIQAAIDKAEEGAVICLAEGTWEENLVIGKGLTLRGLGPEKSVIKGVKEGEPVILISSDAEIEVIVEGLTIAEAKGGVPNGRSVAPMAYRSAARLKPPSQGTPSRGTGGLASKCWTQPRPPSQGTPSRGTGMASP